VDVGGYCQTEKDGGIGMETRKIKLSELESNKGQIEGLPKNPRKWEKKELDILKRSMEDTPELTEARGCVVVKHGKKYVILGGNMRYTAAKALDWPEITCHVLPEDTPIEELKEIVIKDNGSFGAWNWDELANDWDDYDLIGSGVMKSWIGDAEEEIDEAEEKETKSSSESKCVERERIIISFPEDMRGILEEIMGMELDPEKIIIKAEELCVRTEDCE
jgi:hypothetical protein